MRPSLSKLDKIILGVGALFIILLIVYGQFLSLGPLKSDLEIQKQSLASEQKLLDIATQKSGTTKAEPEDTSELQKKIPVQPLQEQVLLDLEKAETVSNSQIKTMSFSKDAEAIPAEAQPAGENAGAAQNTNATQTDPNQAAGAEAAQGQQPATPGGLKKLTVQLSVESPTYEDLEKFIDTLESLTRIVVVESINYSGGQEITTLDAEDAPITYSLTVSAFYLPGLTDLQAEVPKINAPAPAGKENPLSQFPSTAQTSKP